MLELPNRIVVLHDERRHQGGAYGACRDVADASQTGEGSESGEGHGWI